MVSATFIGKKLHIFYDFHLNNSVFHLDSRLSRHYSDYSHQGLNQLQMKGVCHRKISIENLMVHDGKIKIIDFNMCLRVPYSDPINQGCVTDVSEGTIRRLMKPQGQGGSCWKYTAPEVLSREAFDGFAIDLWSAGVILYAMLIGDFPFQSARRVDGLFIKYAIEGKLEETLRKMGSTISKEAYNLLQNMFWEDPLKRLTLSQVMNHPWVTNYHPKVVDPESIRVESKYQKSIWHRAMKKSPSLFNLS